MDTILKILRSNKVQHSEGAPAAGFTLIELLVSMAVVSILLVAIFGMFNSLSRSYTREDVITGVQQSLRGGLEIMVRDIRMAGLDPNNSDNFGIEVASATKIRITSDTNMNGVLEGSDDNPQGREQITYEREAGNRLYQTLYETIGNKSKQPLVENVTNLTFTYLDENNEPPATLADIKTVAITMTVQENAGRAGPITRTLTTRVRLRNLGA